jgi:single-stranded-DNA-specific exonuclease
MKTYQTRRILKDEEKNKLGNYPDLLTRLLFHRGITDREMSESFLNPNYDTQTHDPFLLKDAEKAAERIIKAIQGDQKVVIYSDYDTDGIPAGVALHDLFKKIGFKNFINYIPHRHDEGFGLNEDAINQFIEDKVQLLITIDCGIADIEHVKLAQKNGIDVIITDHHLPGEKLPPAYAIVNPKPKF